jgi:serine phosphatase RsbU (regulator of sigma subunit)
LTTVAAVLLIEVLAGATLWTVLTRSPIAGTWMTSGAKQIAKVYALATAAQAGGAALDPRTTFEPGRPGSIALSREYLSNNGIEYVASPAPGGPTVAFALLVGPDGRVVASTYPARYPASQPVAQVLPSQSQLITDALNGRPGSSAALGNEISVAETVWNNRQEPIGAIYLQEPQVSATNILTGLAGFMLASAVFWLIVSLPVGGLFGMVTTRGVVRRIERLVTATTRFAAGDFAQRVPVAQSDEVGQLEQHFNEMAEQLVEGMAQRQSLVEQQARREERARIEQEMSTAQHIQQSLLPKDVPALPGWQFIPYYKPAREVGGDFYDFLTLDDGRLGIVIGDVTGKGVPAALVMAITRTMLRTAAQTAASPGQALARVNDLLAADITPGMFVTCFYALLDPGTGRVDFANAGHDLPYWRHADGVRELRATGMPLGIQPGSCYDEQTATLAPGDRVLLYSDGLVEAHNPAREMFGFPRLMELVRVQADHASPIDALLCELTAFTGADWEQEDDVTLLVLSRASLSP